tara:strand:+ start:1743 stop:2156 length:414 start_codon:yes stop_codon:yes gene_type:complete
MSTYNYKPGLGLVGAYQVSGIPFVKGPIDNASAGAGPHKITFPNVTKFISVTNTDETNELICGFSSLGVSELTNVFVVPATSSVLYELKVTEFYYTGSVDAFGLLAGLTFINTDQLDHTALSPSGSNWSGSLNASVG